MSVMSMRLPVAVASLAIVTGALLTGCGSSNNEDTAPAATTTSAAASTSAESDAKELEEPKEAATVDPEPAGGQSGVQPPGAGQDQDAPGSAPGGQNPAPASPPQAGTYCDNIGVTVGPVFCNSHNVWDLVDKPPRSPGEACDGDGQHAKTADGAWMSCVNYVFV
ncbi:MAG: hypothetical protein Q4P32_12015, partial [Micrococcales bacterium]|nr:hypothetical protein [Micrococcales bacterium]